MNVVFLGTPAAAVPSLLALHQAGHSIGAVVSQPDRRSGRSSQALPPPVKQAALAHEMEVLQPTRLGAAEFLERLEALAPRLFVVVAYGRILRPRLLDLAPLGAINLHFSLLPRYRGAAPVQWALARGEKTTGVTTIQISNRLDEGDIWSRRQVAIEADEHAPALQSRLAHIGAELLVETVERIEAGSAKRTVQDSAQATYAPLLHPEDGKLDLQLRAEEIAGRIRGFDPWPGVWARGRGKRLRLVAGKVIEGREAGAPGSIVELSSGRLGLVCADETVLELLRVQPEGRRPIDVNQAIHGRQLASGDSLE